MSHSKGNFMTMFSSHFCLRTYRLEVTHKFYKESTTEVGQKYSLQSYTDEASVRLILGKRVLGHVTR